VQSAGTLHGGTEKSEKVNYVDGGGTSQVRHPAFSYTGTFESITSSQSTVKNESDVTQGYYDFTINGNGLITQQIVKNASGTPMRKYEYTYNSLKTVTQEKAYNDGSTLSYTTYYAYDNWGNTIYIKNAESHEVFYSYANTSTSGFFVDNTGTVIKIFTNMFSNSTVPSSVHTAMIGSAEKQDATYVREVYITYDSEAHPTQNESLFGNSTTYQTFSGTFNEYTSDTSFSIDLTGHTVTGNAVLEITGQQSNINYSEVHSYTPSYGPGCFNAHWTQCSWQSNNYKVRYNYSCGVPPDMDLYEGWAYIGPFTHYPGSLGYQSFVTSPSCNTQAYNFTVTTYWKAYPAQVQYNINGSQWKTVSTNLKDTTAQITVPGLTNGQNTLYFSESSAQQCKFSWSLYVPVDNSPDAYTTSMQYDTYGNVTSITDAESHTISFTYSSSYSYAYLTEISITVDQNAITTKAAYDYYKGWITSIQEPKGVDAGSGYDYLYTHDLLGRVTKKEFPLLSGQSQRSYLEAVYDDTNRMATIIDQNRHYVTQQYDKLGRFIAVKWYTGTYNAGTLYATQTYTYRYDDLVSTATDPGNHTFTHTYDFLGRITQLSYPDSSLVSCSYDDTNNKLTKTGVRGYDEIQWFDWLGRLTKVEEEYSTDSFAVTTYQYNESNQLISFTDAEDHTTTFTYDSPFGMTRITYPDSEYEEYEYSSAGNITSFIDCNGNEITFTYDDMYRLTQVQYPDLSIVSFAYDLNSNRIEMEDDTPDTGDYAEYSYDSWNRLVSQTRHIGQDEYTVSYQYDVASRLTTLAYPDGMQILYFYDDLNRMTQIKRYIDGQDNEILMENAQYNTENLLTQFDYGNALQTTLSYDSRDRISAIDVKDGATSFLDLDYTYDSAGDVTQLINGWRDTTSGWHTDTESYDYDRLDRLTSATCTSWSHSYSYDKAGNRTAKDSLTYTINAVNEVTALSDGTSFAYDDNGNRTQKTKGTDTWVYTYDYANRLIKAEKDSTVLGEYHYDGDSRRIQVTENDVTTTYIYGGSSVLYEENSVGTASYIYGPKGLMAKKTTIQSESQVYYYHSDHLGSTRLVTDESGNIVTAATYHPFGELSVEEGSEEPFLFCGKEKDASDLYYFGARYYDSSLGRFITRDSRKGRISDPQSLNRYSYCFNNPLRFKDDFGLKPTFSDEEAQEAYEDQTGQSESDDESDDESDSENDDAELVTSDPNSITLVLPDGTYITLDEYVQEGNVIVGYGYITYTNGAISEMEQNQALCVIALDESGEVENYIYFTEDQINDHMSPEKLKEVARQMEECVGKENVSDLIIALNKLRDKAYELGNESPGERAGKGMLWGGVGSVATIGLGLWPAVGVGALFGLLASFGDDHKWNERENFLGDLLFYM
jgi:RHS repeat-associated protein